MSNEKQTTSGVDWRRPREEGFFIVLPSGNSAHIRPVAMDVLLKQGKVPDLLTPLIAQMIYEGGDTEELSMEKLKEGSIEMLSFIDAIVIAAFVEPHIVEDPQADDEIAIEDVEFGDRGAVYSMAMTPANDLRRFLERQASDLATLQDSDSDEPETVEPGTD